MFAKYGIPIDSVTGRGNAIQPKQQFKFRVRFLSFGGLENSGPYGMDVTQQVVSIQKPNINFPIVEVKTYAGTYKTFNVPTFDSIRLSLRDDLNNTMLFAVNRQLSKQYDFANGRMAVASSNAKFTILIESLDGEDENRAMDAWRLDGCFIASVEYGENNYTSNEAVQINLSISFDEIADHYSEQTGIDDARSSFFYVMSKATDNI